MAERKGMPEEIKQKKENEAKELKKGLKKQKEAVRFELKYKKVKFTEKRKVVRKLDKVEKKLEDAPTDEKLLQK